MVLLGLRSVILLLAFVALDLGFPFSVASTLTLRFSFTYVIVRIVVRTHVYMYTRAYVCMYACMHVCMHA